MQPLVILCPVGTQTIPASTSIALAAASTSVVSGLTSSPAVVPSSALNSDSRGLTSFRGVATSGSILSSGGPVSMGILETPSIFKNSAYQPSSFTSLYGHSNPFVFNRSNNPFARVGAYPLPTSGGGGPPDDDPNGLGQGDSSHSFGRGASGGYGGGDPGGGNPGGGLGDEDNPWSSGAAHGGRPFLLPRHLKLPFPAKFSGAPNSMLFTRRDLPMRFYLQANAVPENQWLIIYITNL